ncbi:2'-5'-oligoadenylate synthase 3-like [Cetorhinus maximus]
MMELYSTEHRRLDDFIKNNLEPNEFNINVRKAVHRICDFLRNRCFREQPEIKVIRAVKGGSSGKGTALRNGSDADLVVFLSCFQSFQEQRNTRHEILEGIQQMLEKCESSIAYEISDISINFIPNSNSPPKSMSFSIKSKKKDSDSVDFDILPTFDALSFWSGKGGIAEIEVGTGDYRRSAEHVKPRKSDLRHGDRLPAKYTVELLAIYAWEQGNGQERFSTAEGFRTVLELICRYQDLCIYWTQNYNVKNRVFADFLIKKLSGKRPIILDPADPTGNVALSAGWYVMVDEAKKCLSVPCVCHVRAWDVQAAFFDARLHLVTTTSMQIRVRTADGCDLTLDVSATDKVLSLRNKIESQEPLSSSQYYLTYGSISLEDGRTLESYCIKQRSNITINLRLRGALGHCLQETMRELEEKKEEETNISSTETVNGLQFMMKSNDPEFLQGFFQSPKLTTSSAVYETSARISISAASKMMDLYEIAPKYLDTLISHDLQPDQRFQQQVGETIDKICTFLKEKCFSDYSSVKIIKTVKGGSAGKGTALKDRSDADLVVFISQFKSFQDQKQNRGEILGVIQQMLKEFQQSIAFEIIMTEPKTSPSGLLTSPRSLNFHFKSRKVSDSIEVDVLPAFDALGQQTCFRPDSQVYVDLINANGIGGEFSTCFTELQRNFVKQRPVKLKGLIRLVKHWYKVYIRPYKQQLRHGELLPPKYALELLIIYAWESIGGGENFNTAQGFRTIMELIVKYRELWMFWTDNYNFEHPRVGQYLKNKLQEPRPMILDPADPTGNVAGNARWDLVANEAENCLQMNCVCNITPWDVEVKYHRNDRLYGSKVQEFSKNKTARGVCTIYIKTTIILDGHSMRKEQNFFSVGGREPDPLKHEMTHVAFGRTCRGQRAPIKEFEITVFTLDGSSLSLNVNIDNTISMIKKQIQQKWDIPVYQQRLSFNEAILDDNKSLLHSGIFFDARLHLVITTSMQIFVRTVNGRVLTLDVSPTDKVLSLRNKIESLERLSSNQYYLTYGSIPLEDGRTLESYGIKQHSTITINLRLRGGAVVIPTSLCVKAGMMELYRTDHRRLDDFIKTNLEPNEFNINVRKAVHKICDFLRNRCFLKQPEIKVIRAVKGGSSGKGTALRNGSDADLVVFLSCFQSFQEQRNTRHEILEGIQQMLEKCALSIAYEISDISINVKPSSNSPPKSMSFSIKSKKKDSDSVDFDILPTFDALEGTDNANEAHLKLINLVNENGALGGEFSSCFTELQRNFVKQCKPKLKDLIRLLKYWYNQHVKPRESELRHGDRLPDKYTVELLAIYAWEQGNGQERFSTAEGFRTVLELICRYQDLCIYWTQNYNVENRVIADFLIKKLSGKRPIILDPADPTGNVAFSTGWYVMVDEANKCLSMPCVSHVRAWDVQVKRF